MLFATEAGAHSNTCAFADVFSFSIRISCVSLLLRTHEYALPPCLDVLFKSAGMQVLSLSGDDQFGSTILMLKLLENRCVLLD